MLDTRAAVDRTATHHLRGARPGAALAAVLLIACERAEPGQGAVGQRAQVDEPEARYLAVTNSGKEPLARIEVAFTLEWRGVDHGAAVEGLIGPELYQARFVSQAGGKEVVVSAESPLRPGDTAFGTLVRLSSLRSDIYSDGGSGNEPPPPPPPPPPRLDVLGLRVGRVLGAALDGRAPGSTREAAPGSVQVSVRDGADYPLADRVYDEAATAWPLLRLSRSVAWAGGAAAPDLSTGGGGWLWLASPKSASLSRVAPGTGAVDRTVALRIYGGPHVGYVNVYAGSDVAVAGSELLSVQGARLYHFDLGAGVSVAIDEVAGASSLTGITRAASGLLAIGDGAVGSITTQGGARFVPWFRLEGDEARSRLGTLSQLLATASPGAGRVLLRDPVGGALRASYAIGATAEGACGADASGAWLFVDDCAAKSTLVFELMVPR